MASLYHHRTFKRHPLPRGAASLTQQRVLPPRAETLAPLRRPAHCSREHDYRRRGERLWQKLSNDLMPAFVIGIVGPSGSGKSTLARSLAAACTSATVLCQDRFNKGNPLDVPSAALPGVVWRN